MVIVELGSVLRVAILLILSAPKLLPFVCVQEAQAEEEKALEWLRRAETHAAKGEYWVAYQRYANTALRYPNTKSGQIAKRRSLPNAFLGSKDLHRSGPSSNRVDIVLMGDGYVLKKQESFDRLVEIVPKLFERNKVIGEYFSYHNIVRANVRSADDGVGGYGREYDTAFKGRASGFSGGQVSVDRKRVYHMLDELPEHDRLALVFVKAGSHGTGGGGVAAIGGRPNLIVVHEWGHAFAGLGDEYSSDVGYRGEVANRPNVSNTDDPDQVPWRHWLQAKTRNVGIHRGGAGRAKGTWKPTVNGCVMDDGEEFCIVCREVLVLRIYAYVDPIDGCDPIATDRSGKAAGGEKLEPLTVTKPTTFEVTALKPKSHALRGTWWVLRPDELPQEPREQRAFGSGDRRRRGPLNHIAIKPAARTVSSGKGLHRFVLKPRDYEPGRYRVICRVRDDTKVRGSRRPWVIKDDHGLLESERAWWVEIPPKDASSD